MKIFLRSKVKLKNLLGVQPKMISFNIIYQIKTSRLAVKVMMPVVIFTFSI